jgi:hypothetical protein
MPASCLMSLDLLTGRRRKRALFMQVTLAAVYDSSRHMRVGVNTKRTRLQPSTTSWYVHNVNRQ